MDLQDFIETCNILNVDEDQSRVSVKDLFRKSVNAESFILSDADEELLILIRFKNIANLRTIKLYALALPDNNSSLSPPKQVHIYKTKNLDINFDDIKSLKPDKSIKCSVKKLRNGQLINLHKNSKHAVKFSKTQYLAIYIASNQNNTEQTYLNGISLNGPEIYKIDTTDSQNVKELNQMVSRFKDIKHGDINSVHFLSPSNVHPAISDNKQCNLVDCMSLNVVTKILKQYALYIENPENRNNNDEKVDGIFDTVYPEGYDTTDLLNDFDHLLSNHSTQFEDIYNILNKQVYDSKACDLSNCLLLRRNCRDRSKIKQNEKLLTELYFNNNDVIEQQILDRIHCYYFHSFDIGYKFTKQEKQSIMDIDVKTNDDDESLSKDMNIMKINKMINSKVRSYRNVQGLERLNYNEKYVIDEKQNETQQYSYGFRFFYWDYYKNNVQTFDKASSASMHQGTWHGHEAQANVQAGQIYTWQGHDANTHSSLGEWFIEHKHQDFKDELLNNAICTIGELQWNNYVKKAQCYVKSAHVRKLFCPRGESAKCFDMKSKQLMQKKHLISIMIYCNNDMLQHKFSETFRKQKENESGVSVKERHRNYYWFGRSLRECVECFGMERPEANAILYHGVNKHFTFSSMTAYIRGPFSTTTDYAVAVNFCNNQGMVMELNMEKNVWRMKYNEGQDAMDRLTCFDCSWLSDFNNEQEIFCIGGLHSLWITAIMEPSGINYQLYIKGLKQMTVGMTTSGGEKGIYVFDAPLTMCEKQMVFRLMSHELWRYRSHHKHAHEFISCPDYFKTILHSDCMKIKHITFYEKKLTINDHLLKYDNGWIKLDLLTTLFPNVETVQYYAIKKDISFLSESSAIESALSFITQNKNTQFKMLQINMNLIYKNHIVNYIQKYVNQFKKYSWRVNVAIYDVEQEVKNITQSTDLNVQCKQIKQAFDKIGIPDLQYIVIDISKIETKNIQ